MKKFFTSLISVFLILGCMMGTIGCGETNSTPPSLNVPSTSESTFSEEPSSTLSSSSSSSSSKKSSGTSVSSKKTRSTKDNGPSGAVRSIDRPSNQHGTFSVKVKEEYEDW